MAMDFGSHKGVYEQAAVELSSKSKRAKEVLDAIATMQVVVDLDVGDYGQGSGFIPADDVSKPSVLKWDSKHAFQILVDPTQTTKKIMGRDVTTTTAKLVPLPANLVLIHELGHVLQYVADPKGFVEKTKTPAGMAEIERQNLLDTEWPVCKDYGIACRSNYMHYDGTSDAVASKWKKVSG